MNKDNIIVAIIEAIGKIGVAIFAAAGLYTVATEIRRDHQEQVEKIQPMLEECTTMMKTSNRYMKLMVDKGFREEQDLYKE